ncbi:DUF3558 family protein [Saccharopolyspora shandongensis]|uniref:DUF3558 family protein n=1 Tax=Saccharopolyspora shandongensis TaxID=418495 RepID=UPI000B881B90|nr:DUF3558 family protein [Saccharopolyspora shandongensis]
MVAAVGAAAGLLLAGCSPSGNTGVQAPNTQDAGQSSLTGFDPCAVLSQQELQHYGVSEPGEFEDQGIGEPGCTFKADGGDYLLTIYKAEKSDRAYWEQRRGNFGVFESNQIGSHQGIKAIEEGSVGLGGCRQIIESGGGSVSVDITVHADKIQSDEATCGKATEIAWVVEPKLPK